MSFVITFKDYDDTVLSTQTVESYEEIVAPDSPTREGYVFTGWNPSDWTTITADTTITATYQEGFSVTFVDYDGTVLKTQIVTEASEIIAPDDPVREGYQFAGWDPSDWSTITYSTTIDATYNKEFTVKFVDYDGTVLQSQTVTSASEVTAPDNPTREGYTFSAWNPSDWSNVTGDTTIIATYAKDPFTVTFKDWDGTTLKTQKVTQYGEIIAPTKPTRTGYTFRKWNPSDWSTLITDTTITATYNKNYFMVYFKDWNGKTLKSQYVKDASKIVAPSNPTRAYYDFAGWVPSDFTEVDETGIILATYTKRAFTATFKDWDGTVLKTQTVTDAADITAPDEPTKEGYTFLSWYPATWADAETTIVITATYSKNPFTVTFKDWNGTVLKTQTVTYGSEIVEPAEPEREGYLFSRWKPFSWNSLIADTEIVATYTKPPHTYEVRVHWPNGEFNDLTNDDIVESSFILTESICTQQYFLFGGCESNSLSFETDSSQFWSQEAYPKGNVQVFIAVDGSEESILFTGYIDSGERTEEFKRRKIIAYDMLNKWKSLDIAGWVQNWYNGLPSSSPMTQKQFRDNLFNYIGVEQIDVDLPNDNIVVPYTNIPSTLNFLSALKDLCMLDGVFGHMTRDGKFEYKSVSRNCKVGSTNVYDDAKHIIKSDDIMSLSAKEGRVWYPNYVTISPNMDLFDDGTSLSTTTPEDMYDLNIYKIYDNFFCGDSGWHDEIWYDDPDSDNPTKRSTKKYETATTYWNGTDTKFYCAMQYNCKTYGHVDWQAGDTIKVIQIRHIDDGGTIKEFALTVNSYICSRIFTLVNKNLATDVFSANNSSFNSYNREIMSYINKVTEKVDSTVTSTTLTIDTDTDTFTDVQEEVVLPSDKEDTTEAIENETEYTTCDDDGEEIADFDDEDAEELNKKRVGYVHTGTGSTPVYVDNVEYTSDDSATTTSSGKVKVGTISVGTSDFDVEVPVSSYTSAISESAATTTVGTISNGAGSTTSIKVPTVTVNPVLTTGTEIASISVGNNTSTLYAPKNNNVKVEQKLTLGTCIAVVTVGTNRIPLYAPKGGSGGWSVQSVDTLPETGEENVLYLVVGD